MDLSRRAKANNPLPESRRVSDFFRPVTTAAYGSTIPLVIGQARVPTTVLRDGRDVGGITGDAIDNKTHYGLCEGPIISIGKMFADQGKVVDLGNAPGAAGHYLGALPWVAVDSPAGESSPSSLSFEVSTDITLAGANGAYVPGAYGTDSLLTTAGQPKTETDFHVCTTGTGASAVQYMVVWSWSTPDIRLFKRTIGGTWAVVSTITSASVAASAKPVTGALPQPRVAAVGNLVHVVWSRLDNAAEPVEICHAWSANAGLTWTYGQSMGTVAKVGAIGAFKLSLSLHSSGEVWVCFQKRNTITNNPGGGPNHTSGICVGFLPSNAVIGTTWIRPDLTYRFGIPGWSGELCLVDPTGGYITWPIDRNLTRAPSIMALGSGKAALSCVFNGKPGPTTSLYVLPLTADTLVRWDLPAAAFNMVSGDTDPHSNVASIVWLNANGYQGRTLGWTPNSANDSFNEGHTQLVGPWVAALPGNYNFGVLVNFQPMASPANYVQYYQQDSVEAAAAAPSGHPDRMAWGRWQMVPGAKISTGIATLPGIDLSTAADPAYAVSAFFNGVDQIFLAMGKPSAVRGGLFWEAFSTPDLRLMMMRVPALNGLQQWISYFPATAPLNSVAYQFWPGNGDLFALMREDEDNEGAKTNGIRTVTQATGFGDVLPSVMCKRLLTGDNHRGLAIRGLAFDTVTWDKFDQYCTAMGIRFSLALTSQEAAWPLVVNILESANAVPFRSQGLLKVFVRETATITGNGVTYTPLPEHAAPCMAIPERDLRDGISIDPVGIDAMWNRMSVGWKNRKRAYADQTTVIQDDGAVARRGVIPASSCDWHWITDEQTALTCAWLRMRHQQRTGRTYSFAVSQKYMLLEPGDIVTVGHGHIPVRPVRILEISEGDADWREVTAEDVVVATSAVAPPGAPGGSTPASVNIASPVNLPIIFVALIGGLLQVWILLSGPSGWRGCAVQQSWDGVAWESVGTCITPSPTGHLLQDMSRLRVQPGLRVHPGLLVGASDFALGDYSEGTALPPWPAWGDYLAGNPGALLWVDGELIAYAAESDNGVDQAQCSILRRGLYGTTKGPHPILSRCGAVTDAAFQWPIPAGSNDRTCYWRFPSFGEDPNAVTTYTVEIPA